MVKGPLGQSILGKAIENGHLDVEVTDVRQFAVGKHKVTDDAPYGGGAGMVMRPEPLVAAIEAARARLGQHAHVVLMTPQGRAFDQKRAKELAERDAVVLVCGRYEGVDERILEFVDEELSIGDFVLTGGELAALCVIDAIARLVPGVLGNDTSAHSESFEEGLLEYPQYTRPPEYRGMGVPAILQCGDHARIARWRRFKALTTTRDRRPDLFSKLSLSEADQKLLATREEDL